MIRIKYPAIGWVWGKYFQVDVSVKRLHVIHMTSNDCIGFSKGKNPSEHKFNMLNASINILRVLLLINNYNIVNIRYDKT